MTITYYERPIVLQDPGLEQGHAVIEASAGTGKTFTLEHLVLDLIITGKAKVEEILVVTFTDAATRELRERVRELIRRVCDEGKKTPPADLGSCWEVDEAARVRLREALFRFDGASISTIHSFCQRILSEQAFLGGRLFEQEHVDGGEMFRLAFREEVRKALAEDGLVGETLRRWIEEKETIDTLEALLQTCHREGYPDRCAITPIWDPEGLFEAKEDLPPLSDLKAEGGSLFQNSRTRGVFDGHLDELFEALAEMREENSLHAATAAFGAWASKKRSLDGEQGRQIDNLRRAAAMTEDGSALQKLSGVLERFERRAATPAVFFAARLLPRVQARLNLKKRALGLIDYDDMLLGVRDALLGPGASSLLDALRGRWRFALVDEFQDTDSVQWEIFRRIFVDGTSLHRLLVIGDPKQAIYGFRGADVHTFQQARTYLTEKRGARKVVLAESYRSTEPLIDSVNELLTFQDEQGSRFFGGLNSYDHPVVCGDPSRAASEMGEPAAPIHLLHLHAAETKLSSTSIRDGLACFIAEEIARLTTGKSKLVTAGKGKGAAPIKLSDIHILTRMGWEGQLVGRTLRRHGIPHAFYKLDGLFQTDEARDVHCLLCAIDSPSERSTRMLAWLTPFFGLSLSDLPDWSEAGENHRLVALLFEWKKLADAHDWARFFDEIVSGSGLVRRLVFMRNERALTNYLHLFELLLEEAHSRPLTLGELARGLKARIDGKRSSGGREEDVQRLETDKEAVQILTMHKAKGLEAEVVFIAGGFSDPRPSNTSVYHHEGKRCLHVGKASGEIAGLIERECREEVQRLMYVALTRARSRLYLPYLGPAPEHAEEKSVYGYGRLGSFLKPLQERLDRMREAGRLDDFSRFVFRDVCCGRRPSTEGPLDLDLSGWPEEGLLELPSSSAAEAKRIEPKHRGVLLTSYTRMSRKDGWQVQAADADDGAARRDEEVAAEVEPDEMLADSLGPASIGGLIEARGGVGEEGNVTAGHLGLPGGREAGIFLHALLEQTPPEELAAGSFEIFLALGPVRERAAAMARRHGFSEAHLFAALELVYRALSSPVHVSSLETRRFEDASSRKEGSEKEEKKGPGVIFSMPSGIVSGARQRPEMAFVYPIPEPSHPLLSSLPGGEGEKLDLDSSPSGSIGCGPDRPPYDVKRGYVQGLIDLVFEHEGRVHLLDWKSDRLPSYDEASLDAHVEANYLLQAKVYSLAVIRLLRIASESEYEKRFGGIVYAFLRGIGKEAGAGRGFWFSRPSWQEVLSWEEELASREEWGGEVIEGDDEPARDRRVS